MNQAKLSVTINFEYNGQIWRKLKFGNISKNFMEFHWKTIFLFRPDAIYFENWYEYKEWSFQCGQEKFVGFKKMLSKKIQPHVQLSISIVSLSFKVWVHNINCHFNCNDFTKRCQEKSTMTENLHVRNLLCLVIRY